MEPPLKPSNYSSPRHAPKRSSIILNKSLEEILSPDNQRKAHNVPLNKKHRDRIERTYQILRKFNARIADEVLRKEGIALEK